MKKNFDMLARVADVDQNRLPNDNIERNDYCRGIPYARETHEIREKFEHVVVCAPEKICSLSIS
jgi:hypothetical protein